MKCLSKRKGNNGKEVSCERRKKANAQLKSYAN